MPKDPVSYRSNPLPQAEIPDLRGQPAPPQDYPVNLYKPLPQQGQCSPTRPSPEASPIVKPTLPRPHPEPYRPTPTPASRQRTVEARAIAQRVRDTSESSRLEYLLRRQQSKRYSHFESNRQPRMALEHLAIARQTNGCFQIVIQGTQTAFSRYVFETAGHCADAAAELEQRFALGGMLEFVEAEVKDAMEAIVRAAVVRERVEMACAV
jgi:hypothetical protein